MIIILDILTLIISVIILLKIRKCKINSILLGLLIFDIAYVMPILSQVFLGYPKIGYYGFKLAIDDTLTCIIYDVFVLIVQLIYFQYIRKTKNKNEYNKFKNFNLIEKVKKKRIKLRKSKILFLISNFLMLAPIFAWIFAPDPSIYFKGLGVFTMNKVITTAKDYEYFVIVIKYCNYVGAIAVILSKFLEINDNKILKINRCITIIIITILNGKRTFFSFIM